MNQNMTGAGSGLRITRRITAFLLTLVLIAALLPAGGCARDEWEGEWNRTGDATYTRAELTITGSGGSDFQFSLTLYNGNIVGKLTDMTAKYTDSAKRSARCSIDNAPAYIDFELNEYGGMDVTYKYEAPRDESNTMDETNGNQLPNAEYLGIIESELFGFAAPAYISGHYEMGDVEYLNQTFYDAGILTAEEDERIQDLMPDSYYRRLMDCFQTWKISNGREDTGGKDYDPHSKRDKHEDEIGAYVYYGSNSMQKYAAIVIIYDDGTASVVVSTVDSAPVYYSSNAIYKDGSLTPLPVQKWLENYNKEQGY